MSRLLDEMLERAEVVMRLAICDPRFAWNRYDAACVAAILGRMSAGGGGWDARTLACSAIALHAAMEVLEQWDASAREFARAMGCDPELVESCMIRAAWAFSALLVTELRDPGAMLAACERPTRHRIK